MPNATTKAPKFFTVPAGTKPSICRGAQCQKRMYWITNPATGRMVPIDCDVEGGQAPSEHAKDPTQESLFGEKVEHHDGRGVSHFTTCVDVDQFSRGAR